jgi:hypothetical protein
MFTPFLGNTWSSMTPEALFSAAKTYYYAHILPKEKSGETPGNAVEGNVYRTQGQPDNSKGNNYGNYSNYSNNNGNNGNNCGGRQRGRGRPGRGNERGRGGNRSNGNSSGYSNNNSNNNSNGNRNSNFDSSKFCVYQSAPGHSTDECRARLQDESYLNWLESQNTAPARANRTCNVRALKTSSGKDIWVYDSCCIDTMTGDKSNFHTYQEFEKPIPVYGVGNTVLYAYGQGHVTIEETHTKETHNLKNVWYVPGINESIISAFQTRSNNLRTAIDAVTQDFIIGSTTGSKFAAATKYIDRMDVFPTLRTVKPVTRDLATSTDNSPGDSPDDLNAPTPVPATLRLTLLRRIPATCTPVTLLRLPL